MDDELIMTAISEVLDIIVVLRLGFAICIKLARGAR